MRYLGSQPGGLLFRAIVTALLILIVIVQFLRYAEEVQLETEKASVEQTVRIVDSGMVIRFSELVVNSQLQRLSQLDGANPFPLLQPYGLVPETYLGEVESLSQMPDQAGWFFVSDLGAVLYRYRYQEKVDRFQLSLKFEDRNGDGLLQIGKDKVFALHLERLNGQ